MTASPLPPGALEIDLAGERIWLLPDRGLYWPATGMLMVADVHLGKSASFRALGVPVPRGVLGEDVNRLSGLIKACGAKSLWVLGDLIHRREGMTKDVIDRVAAWRADVPIPLNLIGGNHDRHVDQLPASWGVAVFDEGERRGPFALCHHPEAMDGAYVLGGHVHPAITLRGGGDSLRLPCFFMGRGVGILPAFSIFTGGGRIRPQRGDRIFCIGEGEVFAL